MNRLALALGCLGCLFVTIANAGDDAPIAASAPEQGAVTAAATAPARKLQGVIKLGYDTGGADLEGVTFADGSTETIQANQGAYAGLGVMYQDSTQRRQFEAILSYKTYYIKTGSGTLSWTSVPLEAGAFYAAKYWRFGAGLLVPVMQELKGTSQLSGVNATFDPAVGVYAQWDWRFNPRLMLGVRYNAIDYRYHYKIGSVDYGDRKVSGAGFGGALTVHW